jgi:hypothetical protein
MAAAEDENLTFALSHAEQLGRDQVGDREDNPEGDEDSHVAGGTSVALSYLAKWRSQQ